MALAPGTRLAHYEIVSLLGAGGMGEVYRGAAVGAHQHRPELAAAVDPLADHPRHLALEA